MILDTNAISALADGDSDMIRQVEGAEKIHVSVVSAGEYLCGIRRSKFRQVLEKWLERLLEKAELINLDARILPGYAAICQELKEAGTPIPANDVWIAAQARLHGLRILSRDRHFDRVQGVERVDW